MALSQAKSARLAKPFIEKKEPFSIQDIFAENIGSLYVVYSYGYHYPMFIYNRDNDIWYENMTRYSQTTSSRHKAYCRPDTIISESTTEILQAMIDVHKRG